MTNSTLLELAIILGIFHLLTNYLHFYICVCVWMCVCICIFQTSSAQQSSNSECLSSSYEEEHILLYHIMAIKFSGCKWLFNRSCLRVRVHECRWKFLQVSKTVWTLSSNTWTHKNMVFANISLCNYFSWNWFQHYGYNLHSQGFNSEIFLT